MLNSGLLLSAVNNYVTSVQVNVFSGAFYDGVYLLGLALNETLSEGGDIRDGINLTRKMWNRDFHGEGSNGV